MTNKDYEQLPENEKKKLLGIGGSYIPDNSNGIIEFITKFKFVDNKKCIKNSCGCRYVVH